jgi:hypothetical protein
MQESGSKNSRRWLAVCAAIPIMTVVMVFIALTSIAPSQRDYLFDRQLLFLKGGEGGGEPDPVESCSGGDECQGQCDLDASCDTDACRGACESQIDARDCGCSNTADACWNRDCEALCSQDYLCESEVCQDACDGDQTACGCTEPQPECFKTACEKGCVTDPACAEDSSCYNTCNSKVQALACGCGVKDECFSNSCNAQCKSDPICKTQACQDACVTEENTLACCGCIKPECGRQCGQDSTCETEACRIACGSLAMQEACRCVLPTDTPTEHPTAAPTERPTAAPTERPTTERPTVAPSVLTTNPQPQCYKPECANECAKDPACADGSRCRDICGGGPFGPVLTLRCGCGEKYKCFDDANDGYDDCRNQCQNDTLCRTQACQDACVTEENTLACCGCIKPECGR